MAYNKKAVLERNIAAIKIALSNKELSEADRQIVQAYQGFGGIKGVLLPYDKPELFTKADQHIVPLIKELHDVLRENSINENEYQDYVRSLKNSVLTSFYTPNEVVEAINESFSDITFQKMLEPSAGAGAFLTNIDAVEKVGIEKDLLTGKILKALHPDKEVMIQAFEKIPARYQESFDLVTSNIPFGIIPIFDPIYAQEKDKNRKKSLTKIHDYFFLKGIDMLKDGGVLAFITSTGVMDSKENAFARQAMLQDCRLISAIRLPENLFSNIGGIDVHSDLIVLQKDLNRSKSLSNLEKQFLISGESINDYYQDLKHVVHSKIEMDTNQYNKIVTKYYQDGGETEIAKKLKTILSRDISINFNKELLSQNQQQIKSAKVFDKPIQLDLFADPDYFAEQLMQPVDIKTPKEIRSENEFAQYIALKEIYFSLRYGEQESQVELPTSRAELNRVYDEFVKEYGELNRTANLLVHGDEDFKELRGIEIQTGKGFGKSDIFIAPVSIVKEDFEYSIQEALSACLNELNAVDIDYISQLSGEDKESVKQALIGENVFYNPLEQEYQTSSKFLSGDVVERYERLLTYSSLYDESLFKETVFSQKDLEQSIRALKEVQPISIPLEEIGLNLGERWIPTSYYEKFSKSILSPPGTPEFSKGFFDVKYFPGTDSFDCRSGNVGLSSYAFGKFSVRTENRRYHPTDMFKASLMDNIPDMTKKVMRDGEEIKVPDKEGIQKFSAVVDDIRTSFKAWVVNLPEDDKKQLETIYNRRFNNTIKTTYDGSFQTFPDLKLENIGIKELYPSQKNAILMIKDNGGGIIDHEVGGGKTLVMCVAAYEQKRLGLANKPLIIGLKANIHEIAATYQKVYPQARVLYPDKKELATDGIATFLSKIQNNNWDTIIMSHEQFEKIPQSLEIQKKLETEALNMLDETIKDLKAFNSVEDVRDAYKRLESKKESLSAQIQGFNHLIEQRKDKTVVDFKTMGIDHILIDESHKYKNLGFDTKHIRAAGLGNPKGSQRSKNLLYALRTIQEKRGQDLGSTFLSGTTISNSLTELYSLFTFLRPKAMQNQGINTMDAWLATYAEKSKEFEFSVTNDIIIKERFRQFCKVPELSAFYAEMTDYKTAEMIGVDRPDMLEHLVNIEQTPDQEEMYSRLKEFAKSGDGTLLYRDPLSDSEEKAKMLIATNTAKKAALDMRLIDPNLFDDNDGNKINHCARNILDFYHKYDEQKGTQFVFCDLGTYDKSKEWNVYSELKDRLIASGIPEHEVRFIHEFKTEKKRTDFQAAMNDGSIRISVGSTEMLGTGINAQQRAVAIHHLDIPWTPKDFIQRNGRAVRAGNVVAKNFADNKVHNFIYAVEKTLDVYKFNLQATKANFISQVKSQKTGVRRIDEGGLDDKNGVSYNEYIAILSGDTSLMEKAKLEKKVAQLKSEETIFYSSIRNRDKDIDSIREKIDNNGQLISRLEDDSAKFRSIPRDEDGKICFKINLAEPQIIKSGEKDIVTLPGNTPYKTYDNLKEAGIVLNSIFEVHNKDTINNQIVGDFYGFPIAIKAKESTWEKDVFENRFFIVGDNILYSHNNASMPRTPELAGEYAIKSLEKIDGLLEKYKKVDKELVTDLNGLTSIKDNVYPKAQELLTCEKELKEIISYISLNIDKNDKNIDTQDLSTGQSI